MTSSTRCSVSRASPLQRRGAFRRLRGGGDPGYAEGTVTLWVDDDGSGDPDGLRGLLRAARAGDVAASRHRGLANMASRAEELGGNLRIRRSRLGGVRIAAVLPITEPGSSGDLIV